MSLNEGEIEKVEHARLMHERGILAVARNLGRTAISPQAALEITHEVLMETTEWEESHRWGYLMMAKVIIENRWNAPGAFDYKQDIREMPFWTGVREILRAKRDLVGSDREWKWKKAAPLLKLPIAAEELQPSELAV